GDWSSDVCSSDLRSQPSSQHQQPDCEVGDYREEYEVEDECLPGLGRAPSDLDRIYCAEEVEPGCCMVHCEDEGDKAESRDRGVPEKAEKVGTGPRRPE